MSLLLLLPHDNCGRREADRLCDAIFLSRVAAVLLHYAEWRRCGRRAPVARPCPFLCAHPHSVALRRTRGFRCGSVSSTLGPRSQAFTRTLQLHMRNAHVECTQTQTGRVSNVGLLDAPLHAMRAWHKSPFVLVV